MDRLRTHARQLLFSVFVLVPAGPLGLTLWYRGLLSEVTAAWAQAAATLWGLAAAYALATVDHRRAEHRRVRDRIEFLETVLHLAHEARELTDEVDRSLEAGRRLPASDFEDVREALDRLPVELMRSGSLALLARQMRRLVLHLADAYAAFGVAQDSATLKTFELRQEIVKRGARIREHYSKIESLVDQLVKTA